MAANLLTDKAIRNAKATDREFILRDGGGLELRVYPNGTKAWQYRYQFQGKRRVLRLKKGENPADYPDVSLAEARALAGEQRKILSKGVDPVVYAEEQRLAEEEAARIAKMEQAARLTFEQVFHQWYETKLSKRKDGADLLRAVRKDIFPAVGDIEMGKVTRGHLMACLDRIAARAPRMSNRMLTTLKTFLSWAVMREIIPDSPLAPVKVADVGGKQPTRDRVLKDDEIIELRDALPKANLPRTTELALWICLATGCRLGELTNAEWAHINLETRRW
ncbi:MAG: integrase arm-type DNA-binding domain-containing protein, partial [Acidithiobacillus sp.]|nr:integrase arm-type DNA-binding domain-containing protein [Acidithiobacillus sp.]